MNLQAQCVISVSAIRLAPDHHSEMISQILFGESCFILEKEKDFCKIKMQFDGTEGWVMDLHIEEVEKFETKFIVKENILSYQYKNENLILSLGSEINAETKEIQNSDQSHENLLTVAKSFLQVPYLLGGRSCMGCDADAFVQLCYKVLGKPLPRIAIDQANLGFVLDFLEESDLGDLAFFEDENGGINHVGIMLNNYEIIHCYDKVRIDSIDSVGIYNVNLKKHTHKLRFVKRI